MSQEQEPVPPGTKRFAFVRGASDEGPAEPDSPPEQEIDLQALAEHVYALLKRELERERERQGRY